MSLPSVEVTIGRRYHGPFLDAVVTGWRRSWTVACPNNKYYFTAPHTSDRIYPQHILYLNVEPATGSTLNGVLFVVSKEELARFDAREWCYERVAITSDLVDVTVEGGEAFVYVGQETAVLRDVISPRVGAVLQGYLDIVEAGLSSRDTAFREHYLRSTVPHPPQLIIEAHT